MTTKIKDTLESIIADANERFDICFDSPDENQLIIIGAVQDETFFTIYRSEYNKNADLIEDVGLGLLVWVGLENKFTRVDLIVDIILPMLDLKTQMAKKYDDVDGHYLIYSRLGLLNVEFGEGDLFIHDIYRPHKLNDGDWIDWSCKNFVDEPYYIEPICEDCATGYFHLEANEILH